MKEIVNNSPLNLTADHLKHQAPKFVPIFLKDPNHRTNCSKSPRNSLKHQTSHHLVYVRIHSRRRSFVRRVMDGAMEKTLLCCSTKKFQSSSSIDNNWNNQDDLLINPNASNVQQQQQCYKKSLEFTIQEEYAAELRSLRRNFEQTDRENLLRDINVESS
ncbi:MAG: hypothetical protein MHMPM18_001050 [Marteilia pararefringens]